MDHFSISIYTYAICNLYVGKMLFISRLGILPSICPHKYKNRRKIAVISGIYLMIINK